MFIVKVQVTETDADNTIVNYRDEERRVGSKADAKKALLDLVENVLPWTTAEEKA